MCHGLINRISIAEFSTAKQGLSQHVDSFGVQVILNRPLRLWLATEDE
jgi:hypothetical protein